MGLNDDNIPESKKKELLDMAHNVLPEGADYDVFSENKRKEIKPFLLYDDIPLKQPETDEKEPPKNEEEQLDSGLNYDVFSENANVAPASKNSVNREYLDTLYKGGIDFSEDTIRMTRSAYVAEYNQINEYYDSEKKKCRKSFLWALFIAVFGVALLNFIELLQVNIEIDLQTKHLFMLLSGLKCGVIVSAAVVGGFFFAGAVKSVKNAEKSRQKALNRLEQRKQELMILGLYDTAN